MTDQTTIAGTSYPGDRLAVYSIHGDEVHLIIDEVDYLAEPKRAQISVDPNKLRDAIDKAAGKREEDILFQDQVGYYHQLAMHPAFDDFWTEDSTPTGREMEDRIDAIIADRVPQEGSKPYRPIDRDRLLRHIEDVEASLTRRNERHEQDQERIRELEADLDRARSAVEVQVQRVKEMAETKTTREYLELAWAAAQVPADGKLHDGEQFVYRCTDGSLILGCADETSDAPKRRLLDPRVEPTKEDLYRKELEGKGLAEWEIELLTSAAA